MDEEGLEEVEDTAVSVTIDQDEMKDFFLQVTQLNDEIFKLLKFIYYRSFKS